MPRLTVAVLARDNEDEIADCLRSVLWADERIVILDTRSRDATAAIAREVGARVIPHRFVNFAQQREFGLSTVRGEWLFYVDTDERATPALAEEIRRVIEDESRVGWWVPRRNFIWGREIRHGGWHPDYQLRLLRLGSAHYDPRREVHEIVRLEGREGYLQEPLIHHNYRTVAQFMDRQRFYATYEADIRATSKRCAPSFGPTCSNRFASSGGAMWRLRDTKMGYTGSGCACWWPTIMASL